MSKPVTRKQKIIIGSLAVVAVVGTAVALIVGPADDSDPAPAKPDATSAATAAWNNMTRGEQLEACATFDEIGEARTKQVAFETSGSEDFADSYIVVLELGC